MPRQRKEVRYKSIAKWVQTSLSMETYKQVYCISIMEEKDLRDVVSDAVEYYLKHKYKQS